MSKIFKQCNVVGGFFENAAQIVQFLQTKFSYKSNPSYYVKEIDPQVLNRAREKAQFKKIETLDGSSSFQVMVFNPHSSEVLASPRLCLCDKCKAEYGSCYLFNSHELRTLVLKESALRSRNIQTEEKNTQNQSEIVHKFLLSGSICAIVAKNHMTWFVKIVTTDIASQSIRDVLSKGEVGILKGDI